MRFYTRSHRFYCGIDLHARSMYVCVLGHDGEILLQRSMPASPEAFLEAMRPYREDLVVGAECIFTWYWLADLCAEEGIPFVLGHALYMRAIHGTKTKNDRIDALKIATLLRGGMLPQAYVYPREMRSTRDLLRRRLYLVRVRGFLLAHVQNTNSQYNLPPFQKRIRIRKNREDILDRFEDPSVQKSIKVDLAVAHELDQRIWEIERFLLRNAEVHNSENFHRLRTVHGVGPVLALTMLYEIHDIARFPRVQEFLSYSRLVHPRKESAGKKKGASGRKIGNVHLKWAFSEAAALFLCKNQPAQRMLARLEKKHGKGKALSILAAKLGRAVYFMLVRKKAFEAERFFGSCGRRAGEPVV
jgi:transposase